VRAAASLTSLLSHSNSTTSGLRVDSLASAFSHAFPQGAKRTVVTVGQAWREQIDPLADEREHERASESDMSSCQRFQLDALPLCALHGQVVTAFSPIKYRTARLPLPSVPPPPMPSTIYTPPSPKLDLVSESLWTFIFRTTRHDPNLPAFIEAATGRVLSRADLRNLSLEFAHGIRTRLPQGNRLFRGDTAMIFSPNSFAWPIALLGLLAGGVRSTLANSAYTPAELAFQYNDSRARVVFSHPDLIANVFAMFKLIGVSEEEARRRLVVLDFGGNGAEIARKVGVLGMSDLLGHGALSEEEKFVGPQAGETLLLCYSSGTTGKPKGVEVCGFISVLS